MAGANSLDFDSDVSEDNAMDVHPIAALLQDAGVAQGASHEDNMDWLWEKNKRERMCEIRSLKLGEKPVTGQGHQESLNNFLTRRFEASQKAASGNVPSNSQNVEEHRPEAVVVEVSGLFERRPVSSMLQSQSFRRDLERIVRGSVSQVRRASAPLAAARAAEAASRTTTPLPTPQQNSPAPASAQTSVQIDGDRGSQPNRTASQPNQTASQPNRTASQPNRTASQPAVTPAPQNSASRTARPPIPPQPPAVEGPSVQPVGPGVPWLARVPAWHVPNTREELSREERQRLSWNSIEQSQRENIISEISELVHRQLVTSSLDGEFRGVLEVHMQEHLQNTGANGRAVQEFVQNIPQSQYIPRNDFSELGIEAPAPPPAGSDSLDSASIISATAHTVPYTQTNLAMSREMHALKAQIVELKQMMTLSFNVQCDIQRSIRQEVAAAMNQERQDQATAAPTIRSVPVDDSHCLICLENSADTVIYSCGHLCLCQKCGYSLQNVGGKCPVCRAPIKDLMKVFKCSAD